VKPAEVERTDRRKKTEEKKLDTESTEKGSVECGVPARTKQKENRG
jgi:hypothetical protein